MCFSFAANAKLNPDTAAVQSILAGKCDLASEGKRLFTAVIM